VSQYQQLVSKVLGRMAAGEAHRIVRASTVAEPPSLSQGL